MKYPSIPHDDKKSVKIKNKDKPNIYHLFQVHKWTIPNIADLYQVTNPTIYWILNPDKYREYLDSQNEKKAINYRTDKFWKRQSLRRHREWLHTQRVTRPEYKKYSNELTKQFDREPEFRARKLKKARERYYRLKLKN